MQKSSSITSALNQESPLFSVEFFPPKDDAGGRRMLETAEAIRPYSPNFVSITYGAGGGTRETTMRYARILQDEYNFEVMPHLTCVGHTVDELLEILEDFAKAGFRNVMALRGDPPQGEDVFKATDGGLSYGSDLVELIRKNFPDFGIGVGGYPENIRRQRIKQLTWPTSKRRWMPERTSSPLNYFLIIEYILIL